MQNLAEIKPKLTRNRKKWIPEETPFSKALKAARKSHHGYTQKYVSEKTGIPRCKLSLYETGSQIPSVKNLNKLRRYYLDEQLISFQQYSLINSLHAEELRRKKLLNFPHMGCRL